MLAAHNDGNPTNNVVENLRWATPSENTRDRFKHGTGMAGEQNVKAVLTWHDVLKIRASKKAVPALAAEFGVSRTTISNIRLGKTWRDDPTTLRREAEQID